MTHLVLALVLLLAADSPCSASGDLDLKMERDRINYSIGYQIGGDFQRQGVELNPDAIVKGIQDALEKKEPQLPREEMQKTLVDLKKRVVADQEGRERKARENYRSEGRAFLEANAREEGVVVLPSGLQYKIVRQGTGLSPGPKDEVKVNYRGTLLDGKEFDSSYRRGEPAVLGLGAVIRGWTEGLQLMKEGAHWQLFIPPELAYGERGPLADRTLIFDVELLKVIPGNE